MIGITISRKEAAEIIGISENTLSQWCKQGMIAFTKKNPLKRNSPYLFTRAACIAAANVSRSLLAQRSRSKHRSYTTNESLNCGA
ncbi:hypothetical protein C9446_05365 [Providencia heimbachae]|nr:hypothetical protein C9446_05365 [Providencia heimbachae]